MCPPAATGNSCLDQSRNSDGKFSTSSTGPPTFTSATTAQARETTATVSVCTKSDATTPQAPETTDTKSYGEPGEDYCQVISASNTALENTPRALSQMPALIRLKIISAQEKKSSFWCPNRRRMAFCRRVHAHLAKTMRKVRPAAKIGKRVGDEYKANGKTIGKCLSCSTGKCPGGKLHHECG